MEELKMANNRAAGGDPPEAGRRTAQSVLPDSCREAARLIRERRTIRRFAKQAVPVQELAAMLKLAADTVALEYDPDGLRFIFFASDEGKRKAGQAIMAAYSGQGLYRWMPGKVVQAMAGQVAKIPLIAAVIVRECGNPSYNDRQIAAASGIIHSFTLLAWERQIGLVWNTEPVIEHELLKAGLGLAGDERLVCLLYVGAYDKLPKGKSRTPAAEKWTVLGGDTGQGGEA